MRKKGIALAFAAVAIVLGASGAGPACFDRQCDPGAAPNYGENPSDPKGHLVDDDTWETTAIDAPWLPYSANTGYTLVVLPWVAQNRPIVEMHAYLSGSSQPSASGNNFAEGSGNSVEFSQQKAGQIFIYNATCANFFVRVVLRAGRPLDAGVAE